MLMLLFADSFIQTNKIPILMPCVTLDKMSGSLRVSSYGIPTSKELLCNKFRGLIQNCSACSNAYRKCGFCKMGSYANERVRK